ncbi:pentatricopeptide repeat-containing protein At1g62910-like [Quercus suber]|uniref:pentatricopeptide repeat-containing protein At1g62910-like n=1 Tax=Quercus suber TaxID=58331 RepID=UPI0032DEC339
MQASGQHPNPQTYAILLDGLCQNKQIGEAMALFQEMEYKRLDHDNVIHYNILIDGLCNVGELTTARELFYSPHTKGLLPNVATHNIMIRGFCKKGLIVEASELLEKMDGKGSQFFVPASASFFISLARDILLLWDWIANRQAALPHCSQSCVS